MIRCGSSIQRSVLTAVRIRLWAQQFLLSRFCFFLPFFCSSFFSHGGACSSQFVSGARSDGRANVIDRDKISFRRISTRPCPRGHLDVFRGDSSQRYVGSRCMHGVLTLQVASFLPGRILGAGNGRLECSPPAINSPPSPL
ncbi:hypothetical protein LZ32DRAFT_129185 [Colletotrichum eremochloae]|nr:hypothetical protein LZ32DRAFT_129185 [Colletotrichum eremochloae]